MLRMLLALQLLATRAAAAAPRPHILLVLADDYGYNDVGYHEGKPSSANPAGEATTSAAAGRPMTPFIDDLAHQSMRLEMYYVQPLCSPTRSTIMVMRLVCSLQFSFPQVHTPCSARLPALLLRR